MMSARSRRREPTRSALAALLVTSSVWALACSERPAECDAAAAGALEALAAESAGELAPRAVDEAKLAVEGAVAHVRDQEQRWRVLRAWDGERCRAGAAALARARAAIEGARATRDQARALEASGTAALGAAGRTLAALAAFVDGGLVGPAVAARIGTSRGAVATAQGTLALTLGELRGAGFTGSLEPLQRVASDVDAVVRQLQAVTDSAFTSAVAACRPKVGGVTPTFTTAPQVFDDWMTWRGHARERSAVLVFRLDRARRACRQVAARVDDDVVALDRDDVVRVWRAGGRAPTTLLTGWNERGAWFVPQGGGMFAFAHERAARFVAACHGAVTCDQGELDATTVEASCTCIVEGVDLAIGDRTRRVRYVWDGRAVRAEL